MIRHVLFDADADREAILDEVGQIQHWTGVRSLRLLELADGSSPATREAAGVPRYCLQLETADAQDAAIGARLERLRQEYGEYLRMLTMAVYREVE